MLYFKLSLLTSFLFMAFGITQAQTFEVIKVRGKITNNTNRKALQTHSKFQRSDSLKFSDASNRLAVMDKKKQVFIVYPQKSSSGFSARYRPVPFKTQGRPGKITSSIGLINHINESTNYLIFGDSCTIEMSPLAFPMNQDSFFYIRYMYDGAAINKQLSFKGNLLIIEKNALFQAHFDEDEKYGVDTIIQINPLEVGSFEFRYFDVKNNRHIRFFDPSQADLKQMRDSIPIRLVFLETEDLKTELEFLIPSLMVAYPKLTPEQLADRIHAYLEEVYEGKIEEENFKAWINSNLNDLK